MTQEGQISPKRGPKTRGQPGRTTGTNTAKKRGRSLTPGTNGRRIVLETKLPSRPETKKGNQKCMDYKTEIYSTSYSAAQTARGCSQLSSSVPRAPEYLGNGMTPRRPKKPHFQFVPRAMVWDKGIPRPLRPHVVQGALRPACATQPLARYKRPPHVGR